MGVKANTSRLRLCSWRFGYDEIRHVVPGPFRSIPPHPLLSFAPWIPRRIGRSAVVQKPPIGRPRVAPLQLRPALTGRVGLLAGSEVPVGSGKYTGVDP